MPIVTIISRLHVYRLEDLLSLNIDSICVNHRRFPGNYSKILFRFLSNMLEFTCDFLKKSNLKLLSGNTKQAFFITSLGKNHVEAKRENRQIKHDKQFPAVHWSVEPYYFDRRTYERKIDHRFANKWERQACQQLLLYGHISFTLNLGIDNVSIELAILQCLSSSIALTFCSRFCL